jgi:hypothetical protein
MTDRSAETTATRSPQAPPQAPTGPGSRPGGASGTTKPAKPPKPAKPATATKKPPAPKKPPRRARLRLTRIDPWSVMKTSFLLAIAFGVVTVVSVFIIWSVLAAAGVWDSVNQAVQDVVGGEDASSWDVEKYVGMSRVMGFTMLVAVVDVILITAIATLGAFLYNMSAALLGGVELTLAEDQR